jgi:subtilisin family serine protease
MPETEPVSYFVVRVPLPRSTMALMVWVLRSVLQSIRCGLYRGERFGGDATNMSLGVSGCFQSLHAPIVNASGMGDRFAIATGNTADYTMGYEPTHIDIPYTFTVSAVGAGKVTAYSGTSMAVPHVTGSLLLSNPTIDGDAIGYVDGAPEPIAHH